MIEIDGLKIARSGNGLVTVRFSDDTWTGEIPVVTNILLYEILNHIAGDGDKVTPFTGVDPRPAPIEHHFSDKPKKGKRGRPKA